jgi:hypothetical protein
MLWRGVCYRNMHVLQYERIWMEYIISAQWLVLSPFGVVSLWWSPFIPVRQNSGETFNGLYSGKHPPILPVCLIRLHTYNFTGFIHVVVNTQRQFLWRGNEKRLMNSLKKVPLETAGSDIVLEYVPCTCKEDCVYYIACHVTIKTFCP